MENPQRDDLLPQRSQREALERKQALENARALRQRILQRRGGKPVTNSVEVINQMREERANELSGGDANIAEQFGLVKWEALQM